MLPGGRHIRAVQALHNEVWFEEWRNWKFYRNLGTIKLMQGSRAWADPEHQKLIDIHPTLGDRVLIETPDPFGVPSWYVLDRTGKYLELGPAQQGRIPYWTRLGRIQTAGTFEFWDGRVVRFSSQTS
jgi:hypothetical protein